MQPILEVACIERHNEFGAGLAMSGFSVASYDSVVKGTALGGRRDPGRWLDAISSLLNKPTALMFVLIDAPKTACNKGTADIKGTAPN